MNRLSRFGAASIAAGVIALASGVASAVPPSMPAIEFPVDTASVATAIGGAGGTILLASFGLSVAFALAWKLKRRLTSAV